MSLINDVLRDLDGGRSRDDAAAVLEGTPLVVAVDPGGLRNARVMLGVVSAALLGAVIIVAWQQLSLVRGAMPAPVRAIPAEPSVPDPVQLQPPAATAAATAATPVKRRSARGPSGDSISPAPAPLIRKSVREPAPAEQAELDYQQAGAAMQQGRMAEAQTLLQQALSRAPDHLPARLNLAGLWIQGQQLELAADLLAEGFAIQPQAVDLAQVYGRLLIQLGRDQDARTVLETAAPNAEQNADYQALLGTLYQRLALNTQAAEYYRHAVALKPDQAVWWLGLGITLERLQQRDAARDAYRNAAQLPLAVSLKQFVDARLDALQQ